MEEKSEISLLFMWGILALSCATAFTVVSVKVRMENEYNMELVNQRKFISCGIGEQRVNKRNTNLIMAFQCTDQTIDGTSSGNSNDRNGCSHNTTFSNLIGSDTRQKRRLLQDRLCLHS